MKLATSTKDTVLLECSAAMQAIIDNKPHKALRHLKRAKELLKDIDKEP